MSRAGLLLLACILVACHSRQGTLTLAVQNNQLYDLSPIGISFLPSETQQQQQQQQATDNSRAANDSLPLAATNELDERLSMILAPKLSEVAAARGSQEEQQDEQQQQQQDQEDHRDMAKRTHHLTDAVIRDLIKVIDDALSARRASQILAPIIRNGRTYPSPTSAEVELNRNNELRRQQQMSPGHQQGKSGGGGARAGATQVGIRFTGAGGRSLASIGDQQPTSPLENLILDQEPHSVLSSGKSRLLLPGLRFTSDKPTNLGAAAAAVVTPFYPPTNANRKHRQAFQADLSSSSLSPPTSAGVNNNNNNNNNSNKNHLAPSPLGNPMFAGGQQVADPSSPFHHRHGSEEVALHPPLHPVPESDYEFKRVENTRWNNLRGMWGKRAISERYNDLQNFKNMLESEARESMKNNQLEENNEQLMNGANFLQSVRATKNNRIYKDNDGDGDYDDDGQQEQRQQQQARRQALAM